MTPKGDPGPGGTNHDFHNSFALGPQGRPRSAQGCPKRAPGSAGEPKVSTKDPKKRPRTTAGRTTSGRTTARAELESKATTDKYNIKSLTKTPVKTMQIQSMSQKTADANSCNTGLPVMWLCCLLVFFATTLKRNKIDLDTTPIKKDHT